MDVQLTVKLTDHRCWQCGRLWYHEAGFTGCCPICAENHAITAVDKLTAKDRQLAALRGVITKLNKR